MTDKTMTDADWRMLQCISQGISNKDIAIALCKSEYTIRNQLSALYKKINVTNRAHAAFWYRDHIPEKSGLIGIALVDRRSGKLGDRRKAIAEGLAVSNTASKLVRSDR